MRVDPSHICCSVCWELKDPCDPEPKAMPHQARYPANMLCWYLCYYTISLAQIMVVWGVFEIWQEVVKSVPQRPRAVGSDMKQTLRSWAVLWR